MRTIVRNNLCERMKINWGSKSEDAQRVVVRLKRYPKGTGRE